MKPIATPYGMLQILEQEDLFKQLAHCIEQEAQSTHPSVGLTGGSTPKAFYAWCVKNKTLNPQQLNKITWMTSDERCVPLDDPESNFGNADRMLLTPLGINPDCKHPWLTDLEPKKAAKKLNEFWNVHFDKNTCFGLCLLGMGSDGHIASIFQESPLIHSKKTENFTFIDVSQKGPRLTITPSGLTRCKKIVMTITGSSKATALKDLIEGPFNPLEKPAQLNKAYPEKVTWLVDKQAASLLSPGHLL